MLQSVPSPTHLSHITNINPFATLSIIKCERYIFLKEFFIIVDYVSACICIRIVVSWLYNISNRSCHPKIYPTNGKICGLIRIPPHYLAGMAVPSHTHARAQTHTNIYIYIYVCIQGISQLFKETGSQIISANFILLFLQTIGGKYLLLLA